MFYFGKTRHVITSGGRLGECQLILWMVTRTLLIIYRCNVNTSTNRHQFFEMFYISAASCGNLGWLKIYGLGVKYFNAKAWKCMYALASLWIFLHSLIRIMIPCFSLFSSFILTFFHDDAFIPNAIWYKTILLSWRLSWICPQIDRRGVINLQS